MGKKKVDSYLAPPEGGGTAEKARIEPVCRHRCDSGWRSTQGLQMDAVR